MRKPAFGVVWSGKTQTGTSLLTLGGPVQTLRIFTYMYVYVQVPFIRADSFIGCRHVHTGRTHSLFEVLCTREGPIHVLNSLPHVEDPFTGGCPIHTCRS